MKLSEFDFDLPEELVANYPSENRDESRLMVIHRETGEIEHKKFKDLKCRITMLYLWEHQNLQFQFLKAY